MNYQSATTAHPHTSKPRWLALSFVITLHVGLIMALSNGLQAPPISNALIPFVAKIIELEHDPVDPVTLTEPPLIKPVIDKEIFTLPPIDSGENHGINLKANPATGSPTERANASIVIPPQVDQRHPLTQPDYPTSSRRAGEEGTVELAILVLASGRIGEVRVEHSSGFARLDAAAVKEALRAWRLLPQQVDGVAVTAWHKIAVTFRLQN